MSSKHEKKSSFSWGTFFRVAVTAGILLFFALTADWKNLLKQFQTADLKWIAAGIGIFGLVMTCIAARWWTLLKIQSVHIPFTLAFRMNLIGQFFNTFLPGSVGGDVVKIFYILKHAPNRKAKAALSILMDRFIGVIVLLAMAVATLPLQVQYFSQHPDLKTIMISLTFFLAAAIAGLIFMAIMPFHRLPKKLKELWEKLPKHDVAESLVDGFRQHGRARKLTLIALALCIAAHLMGFGAGYCLARGLHLKISYFQVVVVLAIVYILMSLPISVSGHGVREFGAVLMFSVYGIIAIDPITQIGKEPALAFGLLIFGMNLVWGLVGGLIYLTYHHQEKATAIDL